MNFSLKTLSSILQGNTNQQMLQNLTKKKSNIKIIDNFVAHLFSKIEVQKKTWHSH
jgi:hypothetical protein